MRNVHVIVVSGVLSVAATGCSLFEPDPAKPLTGDAFVSQRVDGRGDPEPIDRPGQVIVDGVKPPVEEQSGTGRASITEISPTVRDSVQGSRTTGTATTRPSPAAVAGAPKVAKAGGPPRAATAPAPKIGSPRAVAKTDPSGQYVIFGSVLSEVNSRPIYAHKVLASLDSALSAEAKRYDEIRFRPVAAKLIVRQIQYEQREELVFAVAEKSLDAKEKQFAEMLTTKWQKEEETMAGGSLELAKRKWAEEGWDFDERLDYQYRLSMKQLFLQRRVWPMVHVTASDLRHYYDANRETLFTKAARAKFRVIKIDPKQLKLPGGREEAQRLAADIRAKAVKGNFQSLAAQTNDPILAASAGIVPGNEDGWTEKGTYVVESVENAVWALRPGQVTSVIEDKGAYYVAKLEAMEEAKTQEFEDFAVQQEIDRTLRSQQFRDLNQRFEDKLLREAVVEENPQMVQVALDMAMQRYEAWRGGE